jgi:ppGpp synthetase/RelA/SpoT-type nucleotidyltranferase
VSKKYTGKQVIKAGEKLLDDGIIDRHQEFEHAMDVLSYWRFSHEVPLGEAFKAIQDVILEIDKQAIFAKRLKRHISIVNKLKRFNKMKLKNMQDIGGCRAILSSSKKLTQVVRVLKKKREFKGSEGKIKSKDYINHPKDDGYRGYHLVGQFRDELGEMKNIEVQLRTALQHYWATALEIVDIFTGQALKSNQGNEDWKVFFRVVSEQFAVMENIHLFKVDDIRKQKEYFEKVKESPSVMGSCVATQKYSKKLEVVKKLEAFAHSVKIVGDLLEKSSVDSYVLIEVDTLKCTVTRCLFNSEENQKAETKYIEAEKIAAANNSLVVALVAATKVGGIKNAFPNYFADSTEFLKHLLIVTDAPIEKNKGFLAKIFG